jgi:hypothetical protein
MKTELTNEQLIKGMIKLQLQIKELQSELKGLKSYVLTNSKQTNSYETNERN